ncbi:mitochondrial import inner membrane translocase subunit Tim10 B [Parambassis ranga]|uniref:Mitochondrial import inner membrane translocase subunit Tim10 B n=1 Tax=Parambassis ranga TaxID=210632 RepID=A0A6P7JP66_9TELE|nr:mitochondrial import inner membrane translocase subunit Tim10 B [Parambassis ranga]XP_028277292.1 mitochondrial import inner membrane translocase subunit Tim10 B [Parambassis ranga]
MAMDPDQQLRNLRDFLLVYNRMTEICFQRCTSNFNYRNLTMDEERCVDSCAGKLIRSNHRLMGTYVQLMPRMVQRRMEEMESKAAENAKAAEASGSVGTAPTESSLSFQPPITSSLPQQEPSLMIPPVTDVGSEVPSSVLMPAGLDIPAELDAAMSKSTTASEVKLSAAAPFTPVTEAVDLSVPNNFASGLSHSAEVPQLLIPGSQVDAGITAPHLKPSQPMSLSEDVPVAITVSKSKSLSGQERGPEVSPPSGQQ